MSNLIQRGGAEHIKAAQLVRVHPNFRVIALGLPVIYYI